MGTTRKRKPSPKWLLLFLFLCCRTCLADISLVDFAESWLNFFGHSSDPVPCLAYLISRSAGDGESLKRTLRVIYHPRNQYVLHLVLEASALDLAVFIEGHPFFSKGHICN